MIITKHELAILDYAIGISPGTTLYANQIYQAMLDRKFTDPGYIRWMIDVFVPLVQAGYFKTITSADGHPIKGIEVSVDKCVETLKEMKMSKPMITSPGATVLPLPVSKVGPMKTRTKPNHLSFAQKAKVFDAIRKNIKVFRANGTSVALALQSVIAEVKFHVSEKNLYEVRKSNPAIVDWTPGKKQPVTSNPRPLSLKDRAIRWAFDMVRSHGVTVPSEFQSLERVS